MLRLMRSQRLFECGQPLVGLQSTEALLRLHCAGCRPAQCHIRVLPALDVVPEARFAAKRVTFLIVPCMFSIAFV